MFLVFENHFCLVDSFVDKSRTNYWIMPPIWCVFAKRWNMEHGALFDSPCKNDNEMFVNCGPFDSVYLLCNHKHSVYTYKMYNFKLHRLLNEMLYDGTTFPKKSSERRPFSWVWYIRQYLLFCWLEDLRTFCNDAHCTCLLLTLLKWHFIK